MLLPWQKEWVMVSQLEIIVSPAFKPSFSLLGTVFGGNLASAANSRLEVIEEENLRKCETSGEYLKEELSKIDAIEAITGRGLMLGLVIKGDGKALRSGLLTKHHIFTGGCANPNILRLLPPMNITKSDKLINVLKANFVSLLHIHCQTQHSTNL